MEITPREYLLDQQRCLLLAVVGRCDAEEFRRFRHRVDRFAEWPMPQCSMVYRELLRYGTHTLSEMLLVIERYRGTTQLT